MTLIRNTFILLFTICVGYIHAQTKWDSISLQQLSGPTTNAINSLAADSNGVWVATKGGLEFWDKHTKTFSAISYFDGKPIQKIELNEEHLFILTESGRLYQLQLTDPYSEVKQCSNNSDIVTDFDVHSSRLAFATSYSGLIVVDDDAVTTYKAGSSFVGHEPLLSVAIADDLIYVGSLDTLHCSDGNKYHAASGIEMSQFYRLGFAMGTLFIAGVDLNEKPSLYLLDNNGPVLFSAFHPDYPPIINHFSFQDSSLFMATDVGYFSHDNDQSLVNGWYWHMSGETGDTAVGDVAVLNEHPWIATHDFGIKEETTLGTYWYRPKDNLGVIHRFFKWNELPHAITTMGYIIKYDYNLERFVQVSHNPELAYERFKIAVNSINQGYLFTPKEIVDLSSGTSFSNPSVIPGTYFKNGYPFFSPINSAPSYLWNSRIYSLSETVIREMIGSSPLKKSNIHKVQTDTDGRVYFLGSKRVAQWTGGGVNDDMELTTTVLFDEGAYSDLFFDGTFPIYINESFLVKVDSQRHYFRDYEEGFMVPSQCIKVEDRLLFLGRDTALVNVHYSEDLTLIRQYQLRSTVDPGLGMVYDGAGGLWVASDGAFFRHQLPQAEPKPITINNVKFYPNPVSDQLQVEISDKYSRVWDVRIYNTQGQKVLDQKLEQGTTAPNFTIDVSGLHNGTYFLSLTGSHVNASFKFIRLNP
ncbi:MAG: hypothetical protein Salg2KO_16990 [Salibacteraceae bacterium]